MMNYAEKVENTEKTRKTVTDAGQPEIVVRLENLGKRYDGQLTPAVANLSLGLTEGEILAVLGPSGCGKTTTLRLIAGFERPDSGQIWLGGQPVAGARNWVRPEKRRVGVVFQDYALFPHLTVAENVSFGLANGTNEAKKVRVAELLALVGLAEFGKRYPHQLSGGQQQRVAIARALAPDPLVLLLDEPFSNLDAALRMSVRAEVLNILRRARITTILVTHDQEEAFALADRVAIMHQGRLEQLGSPDDLYYAPGSRFVAGFIGRANFVRATWNGTQLVSAFGNLPTPPGFTATPGAVFEALIRPHELVSRPDGEGVSARVTERYFRGPETAYMVQIEGSPQLIEWHSYAKYAPGEKINLALNISDTRLFEVQ
jgi:iron(III) transport system ATP-binding protein